MTELATDLSAAAEALYAVAPEEFMALRTEQVAAAKKAGDKELAKQIGGLRKPTRSAWLVNQLARSAVEDLGQLLDLGAALREAQESLEAASLRTLSRERNRAVDALSRQAATLGSELGYSATETVRQEVAQTLQAALADPETADLVRRGVLHQPVNYGGFGTLELTPSPKPEPDPGPAPEPDDAAGRNAEEAQEAQEAQEKARRDALEALAEAEAEAERAAAEAERAAAEAEELAERVEQLRHQLADAEQTAERARETADAARERADALAAEHG